MKYLVLVVPVMVAWAVSAQATIIETKFEKWKYVRFSHQIHVGNKKLACTECHYLDPDQDIMSRKGHAFCKGCHYDRGGPMGSCDPCHYRRTK
jgi:Pyruvate/2-oxoacid:ferredoxin oxidoreductase delta subunit